MNSTSFWPLLRTDFIFCTFWSWPSSCKATLPPLRCSAWTSSILKACILSFVVRGSSMEFGSTRSASFLRSKNVSASGSAAPAPGCNFTTKPPVWLSGMSSNTSLWKRRMSISLWFLNCGSFLIDETLKSEPSCERVTAVPPKISHALKSARAMAASFCLSISCLAAS